MSQVIGQSTWLCPVVCDTFHYGTGHPIAGGGFKDWQDVPASHIWQHKSVCEITVSMGLPVPITKYVTSSARDQFEIHGLLFCEIW